MGIKFYTNFTFRNIGCDYLFNNINLTASSFLKGVQADNRQQNISKNFPEKNLNKICNFIS